MFNAQIAQNFDVSDVSDLGLKQFGEGNVTSQSLKDLVPSLELPGVPEFSIWAINNNRKTQYDVTVCVLTSGFV